MTNGCLLFSEQFNEYAEILKRIRDDKTGVCCSLNSFTSMLKN